jgi:hypothetical protein
VLPDDCVHERVHLPAVPPHPARHPADEHGEARRRIEVRQAHPGEKLEPALQDRQERVPVLEPAPGDGTERRVSGVHQQELAEVHRRPARRCHRAEQPGGLLLAHGTEGVHAPGAEKLHGADLPDLPPLVAVRRPDDPLGALGDAQADHAAHVAGGEVDVVGHHDLTRGLRGRRDDDGEPAEAEQHQRAVAPREVAHGAVRQVPREMVEVAEHRERPRRRRQT